MNKDQMTPLERAKAIAKGERFDRLPIKPHMGVTLAPAVGVTCKEYVFDVDKMVKVEVELYKRLHHDSVGLSATLRGMAEALGSTMHYPENDISLLEKPIVENEEDIDKLNIANPYKDGKLPRLLEGLQRLRDEVGNEVGVGPALTGPFSVAASVVGTEKLLRWLVKKPEAVHRILEICTISNEEYIKALGKLGFKGGSFSDPVSSCSLLKVKQFREFSLPYLKRNVEHFKTHCNGVATVHICGKSRDIWEDLISTNMASFSLDNIEDLKEAKEVMGDKVLLLGNVPPVDVLYLGGYEDIRKSIKSCVDKAFDSKKGYVIGTGCQIPIGVGLDKLEVFMDAGREFGSYERIEELKKGNFN